MVVNYSICLYYLVVVIVVHLLAALKLYCHHKNTFVQKPLSVFAWSGQVENVLRIFEYIYLRLYIYIFIFTCKYTVLCVNVALTLGRNLLSMIELRVLSNIPQ